jgi:uncharacterized delta-60 repeat protein
LLGEETAAATRLSDLHNAERIMSINTAPIFFHILEPRTLLSAGLADASYRSALDGTGMADPYHQELEMHVDGKSLHAAFINGVATLWRQNQNGSLDESFGSGGKITLTSDDDFADLAVAPDGKIDVLFADTTGKNLHLARFTANGAADSSFGNSGRLTISDSRYFIPSALAVASDGKLVIAGRDLSNAVVYRLSAKGALDNSFGTNGAAIFAPTSGQDQIMQFIDVAIRGGDNAIALTSYTTVFSGGVSDGNIFVLNPDGSLKWKAQNPTGHLNFGPNVIAVDGDGSLVVGGNANFAAPGSNFDLHSIVARFPASGTGNVRVRDLGIQPLDDLAIQKDGKVIVAQDTVFTRLNRDLTPDNSFGTSGQTTSSFWPTNIALQPDGKLIADGIANAHGIGGLSGDFRSTRLTGDSYVAGVSHKTLNVSGTAGNDNIRVARSGNLISVSVNGAGPFFFSFSKSKIKKLVIDAGDGNDTITLSKSAPNAVIKGGNGKDTLFGRRKKDRLSSIERPR